MELVDKLLKGDKRALARLITLVEDRSEEISEIMKRIYPLAGKAYRVGVTGPPGAGKSTLVDKLIAYLREKKQTIGVIAVDATSPFSGGALLGDRIRMQEHATDKGVFIRSMSTRGHLGGLSAATREAARILDAYGKDIIFLETVGVGQSELDIVDEADTTVVVLMPGAGDSVQTFKAGIMEIGDIYVVNKSDHTGANQTATEVEAMLMLDSRKREWKPPVLQTQAVEGEGVEDLWQKIEEHHRYLLKDEKYKERRREVLKKEIIEIISEKIEDSLWEQMQKDEKFLKLLSQVEKGKIDPYTAVEKIIKSKKIKF